MNNVTINKEVDKKMGSQSDADLGVASFDPATMSVATPEQAGRSNHWEVRTQEQGYAFLPTHEDKSEIKEKNRYG